MLMMGKISYPSWLFLLFAATLALGTDEFVISGILPAIASDLGTTTGHVGLLVTAFALAFCIASPVIAVATDKYDKKKVLVGGLLIFAIANGLMVVVNSLWLALVLRVIAGISASAVSPTAMAIAGSRAPSGREGKFLSIVTAGLTVALFTGVPFGAWIGDIWSWRGTFLVITMVTATVTLLSAALTPHVPGGTTTSFSERLSPIYNRDVILLVIAMFLNGAGGLTFYSYLGSIVEVGLDESPSNVTRTLLLVGVVGVVAVFLGGILTDRAGHRAARSIIIGGHAVSLGFIGTFLLSKGTYGIAFFMLIACWSVFAWALSPAMQASLIAADPDRAMLAASLGISGMYGGAGIGAAFGGFLFDHVGLAAIPLVSGFLIAVAWVSVQLIRRSPTSTSERRS